MARWTTARPCSRPALREVREEAGPDLRVRPLGVVHASTFAYDDRVRRMISVVYLMAHEGGGGTGRRHARKSRPLGHSQRHYVFELLSDHGNYSRFRRVRSAEVVREGVPAPNGLGAIRRIALGPIVFEEEITAFEPPTRMDYLIREVNLPLDHRGGTITLSSAGNATQVLWISEFETRVPLIGRSVGATGAALFKRGFSGMLDQIERRHRAASQ